MTKVPGPSKTFPHTLPGQHVYHGVLFFGFSPPDTLDAVKDFQVKTDDVFVVTYPKAAAAAAVVVVVVVVVVVIEVVLHVYKQE
ncbi:sulfotransferase 1A1-like [Elysia marginata]|uniref:Sulfotransferase 1A1-like n=1 Tax=Elysia marginata TaxID=1093978 RepID=A0AAV4G4R2_9GAST|nr:sulfotransferase 1A1-like [Elysia marginata]